MTREAILYTDGSCNLDGSASGVGYLARCDGEMLVGHRSYSRLATTSTEAEFCALGEGLVRTIRAMPNLDRIVACTDNEAVVRAWKGRGATRGRTRNALFAIRDVAARERVALDVRWVKGHDDETTVAGYANGVVDRLAKHAKVTGQDARWRVRYRGDDWARALAASSPVLREQPRYVGEAGAARWLGIGEDDVRSLVARGGLTQADRGLLTMTSVRRMRRLGFDSGLAMPDMSSWSPGGLDVPPSREVPLIGLAVGMSGSGAAFGCATRCGGKVLMESFSFGDAGGRLVAEIDGLRYAIERMGDRLPPVAEVRVQVASEGVRSLVSGSAVPGDAETAAALRRFKGAVARCRALVAVERPGRDAESDALAGIARHLAGQALGGTGIEGEALVEPGWQDRPEIYEGLGMPFVHDAPDSWVGTDDTRLMAFG